MPKKVACIDGNSLMHRAYHAVPPTMNAPDGTPTNACFGFLSMLLKFIDIAHPDAIICAFDAGKPKFRMEALEQYKAQRPPMDNELRVQFPIMEELLGAMGIPVVKMPGWEGDDILGTVAARDEALGYETLLVTGDKDACQLASDKTFIVTTKKGITDVVVFDPAMVEEKYGVTPAQFPDFLGLMGDSSDNIPGVPGIGQKTAAKLLQQFGSMDGLYENLDKLKGKQLEHVRDNKDLAYISRQVATIVRDVDLELDVESVAFPAFDAAKLREAFGKYRFSTHLSKVLSLQGEDVAGDSASAAQIRFEPMLTGKDAKSALEAAIGSGSRIGIAFCRNAQETLFGSSLSIAFACPDGVAVLEDTEALEAFADVVRSASFSAFDLKETLREIFPADSGEVAYVDAEALLSMDAFDVDIAAYVLDSSRKHTLAGLAEYHLGSTLPALDDDLARAACAAVCCAALVDPLTKALEADGSWSVYAEIDAPLVGVLAAMERAGARIDAKRLSELGDITARDLEQLRDQIYKLAGEEFNIDSPQQLAHILFEVLGLRHGKKTKRGYSTDASVLKDLANDHELPGLVLSYRELAKMKSTYIDALPRMASRASDGRVHTTFNQTVTTTGRLSSSDPNLQNIPVRTDFGKQIRTCFIPLNDGEVFLSADYSQIELRLLAHLSGDERLIEAFCSGADFHAATAASVFGVSVDEVTPAMRSRAKAVNFGIVYGQQAFGLAQSLEIPVPEARSMIERYFSAYPRVREYLDQTVEHAKELGYAQTMFGRKRHIPELRAGNANMRAFGERTAMNHPMQGSAADIIKLAMRRIQERLLSEGLKTTMLLQVHDELDFSVPKDELEYVSELVGEIMEHAVALSVPLRVDVSYGEQWAQAH
ncbi:MAG: DNA polymerase I [Eggerthellaceae bacterium]|nr:DNA polymerase I [Eggerthellaceae bacterium]